ncbi:hypothetical protein GCM10010341_89080 [Streptomyces noursei]|nr:hypothetical protein GCM10010341_89080 [Streptomyces noursei]
MPKLMPERHITRASGTATFKRWRSMLHDETDLENRVVIEGYIRALDTIGPAGPGT